MKKEWPVLESCRKKAIEQDSGKINYIKRRLYSGLLSAIQWTQKIIYLCNSIQKHILLDDGLFKPPKQEKTTWIPKQQIRGINNNLYIAIKKEEQVLRSLVCNG